MCFGDGLNRKKKRAEAVSGPSLDDPSSSLTAAQQSYSVEPTTDSPQPPDCKEEPLTGTTFGP